MTFAGFCRGTKELMEGKMTQSQRTAQIPADRDGTAPPAVQVLDPRTLGRPIHLLHAFAAQLREDLSEVFRTRLNRRYRADFQVQDVSIDPTARTAPAGRWTAYGGSIGRIGCTLDRSLVLSALTYRYGLHHNAPQPGEDPEPPPETATEERLAAMLGLQMAETLAVRIEAGMSAADGKTQCPPGLALAGPTLPPRCACLIRAVIRENTHGVEGSMHLALDEAWMARLLDGLAPLQRKRSAGGAYAQPLASRLHFKLAARLLQKDLPLGELLAIQVGDVIPVSLRAADVLIDDSRLFTATVAEHKGKLCLTSFEDAK